MPVDQIRRLTPEQRQARADEKRQEQKERNRSRLEVEEEKRQKANQLRQEYVNEALSRMRQAVVEGRTPSLMVVEYLPSQYTVDGREGGLPPDARALFEYGLDGWDVVTSFPHTTGKALTNSSGGAASYGGGLGGLVDGVFVVLRLPVTAALLDARPGVVADAIVRVYESRGRHTAVEKQVTMGTGSLPQPVAPQPTRSGRSTWFGYGISVPMGEGSDFDFGD